VYPDGHNPPKPNNWRDIQETLARSRPLLSPSEFTDEYHAKFLRANAYASSESKVTETVISFIEGNDEDVGCMAGGIAFRNLDHLTDGTLVPGNPDRYHGARLEQVNERIQKDLGGQIIPSTQHDRPVAPNFFLAVKGPTGSHTVAERQACYDGALGARGMHSLQEYGKDEPDFDNKAYTISSTYEHGFLSIFVIHPSNAHGRTEYYMTQLASLSLIHDVETFRQAVTWYRNARDWAKEQRNDAIRRANERITRDVDSSTTEGSLSTVDNSVNNDSARTSVSGK
jgi:hypothetical protein